MKGDYSRMTFKNAKDKAYSSVLMQQGRVQLDADWNEQQAINQYRQETALKDVLGESGTSISNNGFAVSIDGNDVAIDTGHYYVDGILCENHEIIKYADQMMLTGTSEAADIISETGAGIVYLDVWQRNVTAIDDPYLRETALGGPDTTARQQVIWQVKILPVNVDDDERAYCATEFEEWNQLIAKSMGTLTARTRIYEVPDTHCILPPKSGYQFIDNQLYRVEIHKVTEGKTTFKWSRDNGSVIAKADTIGGNTINCSSAGYGFERFEGAQWIEVFSDYDEFNVAGPSGLLVQVQKIELAGKQIILTDAIPDERLEHGPYKVRRWDQTGVSASADGVEIPDSWVDLEGNIQVKFSGNNFRVGDYWIIPARPTAGEIKGHRKNGIEWPLDEKDDPLAEQPLGNVHHYARLAFIKQESGTLQLTRDCRQMYAVNTQHAALYYVGGDGQHGNSQKELTYPLQVGVSIGKYPIAGARVKFINLLGNGGLVPDRGLSVDEEVGVAITNEQGIAQCKWTLDAETKYQRVEARLLDGAGQMSHLPLRFSAMLDEDPAFFIEKVQYLSDDKFTDMQNDSEILATDLENGIFVDVKEKIDSSLFASFNRVKPVCFTTIYLPYPLELDIDSKDTIAYQPVMLIAEVTVSAGNHIVLTIKPEAMKWLDTFFDSPSMKGKSLLATLTIKGNFVWSNDGETTKYLDGEAFGFFQRQQTQIKYPTKGDGKRGGDFEMWFWITKYLSLEFVSFELDPPELRGGGVVNGLVTLNKPAPAPGITLEVSASPSSPVRIRSNTIAEGETTGDIKMLATSVPTKTLVDITVSYESLTINKTLTLFPPLDTFRVEGVEVVHVAGESTKHLASFNSPQERLRVIHIPGETVVPNGFLVTFSDAVDSGSINSSNLAVGQLKNPGDNDKDPKNYKPLKYTTKIDRTEMLVTFPFPIDELNPVIGLIMNNIKNKDGSILDGEVNTMFPSGDGKAGGVFLCRFRSETRVGVVPPRRLTPTRT